MITVLTGENNFEVERALHTIVSEFDGMPERIDGMYVELKQLPDLLFSATLFARKRLIVIRSLSENKVIWSLLENWIERIDEDIHVVLIAAKLDKRTKTYKVLQKHGQVKEYKLWSERDTWLAEKWVGEEASSQGLKLDKKSVRFLVERVGVDQWMLYQALQKLAVVKEVSLATIEEFIDTNPAENVFNLLETALKGDLGQVMQILHALEFTEDPYGLFGMLSSQVFQLTILTTTKKTSTEVAKEIAAHPFVLSKLVPYAKDLGRHRMKEVIAIFVEADNVMKSSTIDPWIPIERALIKTSHIKSH
jgi:DNA polymerase-3 subunit delta